MKRTLIALSCLVLFAIPAYGQGGILNDNVLRADGTPAVGATVRVCTEAASGTPCSPTASIYSDKALTIGIGPTLAVDAAGAYTYYASPGFYKEQICLGATCVTRTVLMAGDVTALVVGTSALGFSATPTFDSSANTYFSMTLTGNVTSSTISNAFDGRVIYFNICQDATGGRTFTWPASVLTPPTVGTAVSSCTSASFIYDGTNWRELAASSRGSAVFDTVTTGVFDEIRVVNGSKFACSSAGINAADTDLGSSLGEIWVTSACDGSSFTAAVTITNGHKLKFSCGTFDFQAAVTFKMGSQLSGCASASNNVAAGTELEHNFSGDFLIWDGQGTANRNTGGGIRNILINNTYTGGDLNGNLVVVKGTSASQRAGAFAFENLTINGLSATNRHTRGILIDGSALGGTDKILDVSMIRVKVSGSGTDFEDIRLDAASAVISFMARISNFNNGAQTAGITVTGTATAPSTEIHFVDSGISGTLALDRVGNFSWLGGSINTVTNTANCTGNILIVAPTITNAPTNNCGNNFNIIRLASGEFTFNHDIRLLGTAPALESDGILDLNSQDATDGVRVNRNGVTNAPFQVKESGTNTDNFRVEGDSTGDGVLRGSFHPLEGKLSNSPRWIFKQVDFGDMTAAATADTFTLWTLPANTMIHDLVGVVVTGWSGGSISAAVASVGTQAGAANDLGLDDNFFAAGARYELHDATASGGKGALLFDTTDKFAPYWFSAGGVIELQMDLTGDNHVNATAGQARIYLLVSQPLANTATEAN